MNCPNCLSENQLNIVSEKLSINNIPTRVRECGKCGQKVETEECVNWRLTKLKKLQK